MEMSTYQSLKLVVLESLNLSKDAVHMHIGLMVLFLAVILWRRGRLDYVTLLPVFLVAIVMECLDIRDDMESLGHMRWSAYAHDIINTVIWPTLAVFSYKWFQRKNVMRNEPSQ